MKKNMTTNQQDKNSPNNQSPKSKYEFLSNKALRSHRIHRITPSDSNKWESLNHMMYSEKKGEAGKPIITYQKQVKKENEKIEKEKQKRKKLFELFTKYDKQLMNNSNKGELNHKINSYYLIFQTWLDTFKIYCNEENITINNLNKGYPGKIVNDDLFINDEKALKLNSEKLIIIKLKYSGLCRWISEDEWKLLVKNFGGGPEIIFNKYSHVLEKSYIRVNLFFIPKRDILNNINNKEPSNLSPFFNINIYNNNYKKIKLEHFYFNIDKKNTQDLSKYINQIMNNNRSKFSDELTNQYNGIYTNYFVEDLNYRLWLFGLFNVTDEEIVEYLNEQLEKFNDADLSIKFREMDELKEQIFTAYLLNNFNDEKIIDIFPNIECGHFKDILQTENLKIKDENDIPIINILVEESQYHFETPEKLFFIKKCNNCGYKTYVNSGCCCNKVFYCSSFCRRKDIAEHFQCCKEGLEYMIDKQSQKLIEKIYINNNYTIKKGLTNLGNTCYMNSSLQCIFAIKELIKFFFTFYDESLLNKKNKLGTQGILTKAFMHLLLAMKKNDDNKYYTPNLFKIALGISSSKFRDNEQEDAHEFINYFLDALHEDLNKVIIKPKIETKNENNENDKLSDEEKSLIDWNEFLKRNQSIMVDLFYGQYKSVVTCPLCEYHSINFNIFLNIELPIPINKNFLSFQVIFQDYDSYSPLINLEIRLNKDELYVYYLRKKIAVLLDIDPLEFELVFLQENEIVHFFLNDEIIQEDFPILFAFRINPGIFYSHYNERYNEIINNKKKSVKQNNNGNELIYHDNDENRDFNNDIINHFKSCDVIKDSLKDRQNDLISKIDEKNIEENDILTNKYNDFKGLSTQEFIRIIIKSYMITENEISLMEKDNTIYLGKSRKCIDIYYDIFAKYAMNLIHYKSEKTINIIWDSYDDPDYKEKVHKHFFPIFFKELINNNVINDDYLDNQPDAPFVLCLIDTKNERHKVIPFDKELSFKDFIDQFYLQNQENNLDNNNTIKLDLNNDNIINNNIKNNNDNKNYVNNLDEDINKNNNNRVIDLTKGIDDMEEVGNKNNNDNNKNNNINLVNDNNNTNNDNTKDNNEITTNRFIRRKIINKKNNYNNSNKNNGLRGGGIDPKEDNENENEDSNSSENNGSNSNVSSEDAENDNDSNSNAAVNNDDDNNDEILDLSDKGNESLTIHYNKIIQNEIDKNTLHIGICWNSKYIKEITRINDIDLQNVINLLYEEEQNKTSINLEQCFINFSKEEKLDSDNSFECPKCKKNVEATKKIEIYNVPKILIIQLKRFDCGNKIKTQINFPLTDLNMNNYMTNNNENNIYDLFAVANHYGTLTYGHYTAYCKNYDDGFWYEYNDRVVTKIDKENEESVIVSPEAYLLFYRQKKNDLIKWDKIFSKNFQNISENNMKHYDDDFIYEEKVNIALSDIKEFDSNKINNINKYAEDYREKNFNENDFEVFSFKNGVNNSKLYNKNLNNYKNNNDSANKNYGLNIELIDGLETPRFKKNTKKAEALENIITDTYNKENKTGKSVSTKSSRVLKVKLIYSNAKSHKMSTNNKNDNNNKNNITYMSDIKNYKKDNKDNKTNIMNDDLNDNLRFNKEDIISDNKVDDNKNKYNIFTEPFNEIFNNSKNYFDKNKFKPKTNKGLQSVKNKKLIDFIVNKYSSNDNNVLRTKKLKGENEKKVDDREIITIKEEDDEIKKININDVDLNNFVYNPFSDFYSKIKKTICHETKKERGVI